MARIRTIKPEFWEDEKIGVLSHGARLLFIGCLNFGDDEGLVRWNPMYLGASIFPYDDIKPDTIQRWMKELIDNELVFVYQAGRVRQFIAYIINFHKHQRIDKPQPSKFPPPNPSEPDVKETISRRDYNTCCICGYKIEKDNELNTCTNSESVIVHIKPKNTGGADYFSNLKIAHTHCYQNNDENNGRKKINSGNNSGNYSQNNSPNNSNTDSDNTYTNNSAMEKELINENKKNIIFINKEEKILSKNLFEKLEKISSSKTYLATLCKNNSSIKDLEMIKNYLKTFFVELENREETEKTEKEIKSHFASWLNIRLEKERKSTKPEKKQTRGRLNHVSTDYDSGNFDMSKF